MSTTEWEAVLTMPVAEDRDHIQGPAEAAVTLVEYGDYECSYCGAAYPIIKQVQARMGERLRFVFRNFPITTSHPHAEQAAEAAEAAAAQGRFWRMHDLLYENQQRLRDQTSAPMPSSSGSTWSGSTESWPTMSTPSGSARTS
jgi:protein-disulfide isomerase